MSVGLLVCHKRPLRLGQQRKFNLLPVEDTAVFWDLLKRVKQTTSELQLQCTLCYSSLHPCKQKKSYSLFNGQKGYFHLISRSFQFGEREGMLQGDEKKLPVDRPD